MTHQEIDRPLLSEMLNIAPNTYTLIPATARSMRKGKITPTVGLREVASYFADPRVQAWHVGERLPTRHAHGQIRMTVSKLNMFVRIDDKRQWRKTVGSIVTAGLIACVVVSALSAAYAHELQRYASMIGGQ